MADVKAADSGDWDAVARAMTTRLSEMRMTQMELANRAKVSLTTVRELQHNLNPRRRRPQTLASISEALGWPANYLETALRGEVPEPHGDEANDSTLQAIGELDREVRDLRARIEKIERELGTEGGQP